MQSIGEVRSISVIVPVYNSEQSLETLVTAVEKDPAKLKPQDRQLLYLNAGEAAQKAGDNARAQELWKRGFELGARQVRAITRWAQ